MTDEELIEQLSKCVSRENIDLFLRDQSNPWRWRDFIARIRDEKARLPLDLHREQLWPRASREEKAYVYQPGEIIVVTSGSYSDYGITDLYQVAKPFSNNTATAAKAVRGNGWYFPQWLEENGYAKKIAYREINDDDL